MSRPLDGVRVLEVASWTYVPSCSAQLADMGADIVKVEPPSGDPQRALRNTLNANTEGPNTFVEIPNRGKRSITLDLRTPAGRDLLLRLAATSDVFLTSYLPAVCARLGIEVADLRAGNPRIIYGRGTGWGSRGPLAEVGGYDLAAGWAISGLADRFDGGAGGPICQPPALFDLQASTVLAGAVAAALFKRERTGEPSVVDVAIMNVAMWAAAPNIVSAPYTDTAWDRTRDDPPNPLSNWYRTRDDRWLYLVLVQSDPYWRELCDVLGRADLADDVRFADSDARHRNSSDCVSELDEIFGSRTLHDWMGRFEGFSGPWAPALTFAEVHEHPQVRANDFLVSVTANDGGVFDLVAPAFRFDGAPPVPPDPAPELGQHTELVLLDLGLDWDEITAARNSGALG